MQRYITLFTILIVLSTPPFISQALTTITLPQSGQSSCWDGSGNIIDCAGTGQDGDILAGIACNNPRFIDNGNQTVTDNLSGLIWVKNANLMKTRDPSFDVDSTLQNGAVFWQHALDYIKKLNTEKYLGHNDWRLPNINELRSLTNRQQSNMLSLSSWLTSQGFTNINGTTFWSSTTFAPNTLAAWCVDIYKDGSVENSLKNYATAYVWPVRSGQFGAFGYYTLAKTGPYETLQAGATWPYPRFTVNTDQTVTDNLTGLIWTKNANPTTVTNRWQYAFDYINTLNSQNYLGYSDWRLPNREELASLTNWSEADSVTWLQAQGFNRVQPYNSSYWSSSTNTIYSSEAWLVDVGGFMRYSLKSNTGSIWPVRGGYVEQKLTINKIGAGAVTSSIGNILWAGSTGTTRIVPNANVTLTTTPDPGFSFAGWSGACNGTATCSITMDMAKSVTATFVPIINGVCGSSSGHPLVAMPSSNLCTAGAATTVTGIGPWNWSCTGQNGGTTANCSATVGVSLALSFAGTGGGSVSGGIFCTSDNACLPIAISKGINVNLMATPNIISTFDGWSGDCIEAITCNLTMDVAKHVTANFKLAPKAKIGTTGYTSFDEAYVAADSGSVTTIMLLEDILPVSTVINKPLILQGGYLPNFARSINGETTLQGTLAISFGSVQVDRVVVK